ncbi:MAG: PRC-barrel domain-containing protein [Proteobacteria bacterium]|nr:PRC-barrel domain-containing protein [Pseudomonadota bacterium]
MRRTPLIFAAMIPFVAVAGPGDKNKQAKVDLEKLRGAVPVTAVLGEEVRSENGQEVGEIQDIVLSRDGKIEHVLIEADDAAMRTATTGERQTPTQRADASDRALEGDQQRTAWMGDSDLIQAKAKDVQFNADDSAVTLKGQGQPASEQQDQSGQQLRASEIVGMEVNLSDEESFGDVEDVMIGGDGKEVVAIVVDNWDGLEKKRRAFPLENVEFDTEAGEINYQLTSQDVEGMDEFNLDRYENQEWFNVGR